MPQRIVAWDLGIRADWYRANELISLRIERRTGAVVEVILIEYGTEDQWRIVFHPYQAVRVTTEECIWPAGLLNGAPQKGGFYEVLDSNWIESLGKGKVWFLEKSRHFVIGTYDDFIEVVASDYKVNKLT